MVHNMEISCFEDDDLLNDELAVKFDTISTEMEMELELEEATEEEAPKPESALLANDDDDLFVDQDIPDNSDDDITEIEDELLLYEDEQLTTPDEEEDF